MARAIRIQVGDLSAERDFIDVRDAVEAYFLAWQGGTAGEVYNVCSGTAVPIRTVLESLISFARVDCDIEVTTERLRRGEVSRYYGSPARLLAATNWRRVRALPETLADLLDDWRIRLGHESSGGGD